MMYPRKLDNYFKKFGIIGLLDSLIFLATMALLVFLPMFHLILSKFSLFDEAKDYFVKREMPNSTFSIIPFVLAVAIGVFTVVCGLCLFIGSIKFFGQNTKIKYYNAIKNSNGGKTRQDKKFASCDSFIGVVMIAILYIAGILLAHYLEKPDVESVLTKYYNKFTFMSDVTTYYIILPILMIGLSAIIHFYRIIIYNNMRHELYNGFSGDDYEVNDGYNDYDGDYDDYDDDDY